jgi:CheY-like chemotaxis protein
LDMLMPVMDGVSFLKSVKLPTNYPDVKTIIVSNLSNAISKEDSQKYGVVKTIIKVNFSPQELVTIVKEYCPS